MENVNLSSIFVRDTIRYKKLPYLDCELKQKTIKIQYGISSSVRKRIMCKILYRHWRNE